MYTPVCLVSACVNPTQGIRSSLKWLSDFYWRPCVDDLLHWPTFDPKCTGVMHVSWSCYIATIFFFSAASQLGGLCTVWRALVAILFSLSLCMYVMYTIRNIVRSSRLCAVCVERGFSQPSDKGLCSIG